VTTPPPTATTQQSRRKPFSSIESSTNSFICLVLDFSPSVAQSRLGEKLGFISHENEQRVEKLLERAKLPTKIPEYIDRRLL